MTPLLAGRCPQRACFQPVVLLSHTHLDHVGGLPFHACTRSMLRLPPSRVVTPPGYGDRVRKLLDAVQVRRGVSAVHSTGGDGMLY